MFWPGHEIDRIKLGKTSGLIWIQSDGMPAIIFLKVDFEKDQQTTKAWKNSQQGMW